MFRSARRGRRLRACAPVGPAHRRNRGIECLGALAAGVVALVAAAPEADAATCPGRNFVDRMSVSVSGTVRATSSDGKTYDNIRAGSFDADYSITLCGDGALDAVIVHLGQCTGRRRGCDDNPIMYQEFPSARSLTKKTPTFTFAPTPDSGAGQSILKTCNAHADEQRGAGRDKEIFPGFFGVTLGVDTRDDPGILGLPDQTTSGTGPVGLADQRPLTEYSKTEPGTLTLKILCAPLPAKVEEIRQAKIAEAALGVAASGNTCPKPATATVTIAAEAPRPVFYKIERGNGTTTTADWIEGRIKLQKGLMGAKSAFLHAQHDLGALDPGTRKFRLWIDGWGKTPWQTEEVDCVAALRGKLTLKSLGATACRGEALVAIHTDGAGTLPYELECGPGRSWQRSVTAPANRIGVDKVQFDVSNKERVTCVLRTRIAGKLKPLDGDSKTFQCHRPADVSATDDLVPVTRPDPKGPRPPLIVIDPPRPPKVDPPGKAIVDPPRLSCAGGVVNGGQCLCPRTHKAVHAGKNAWRCVRSATVDPPRKVQVTGPGSQKATKAAAKAARKALRERKGRRPVP